MTKKMPYLYEKLSNLVQSYEIFNEGYVRERNRLSRELPSRFRLSKKEIPLLFREISDMKKRR
jgi:hypothetical protein